MAVAKKTVKPPARHPQAEHQIRSSVEATEAAILPCAGVAHTARDAPPTAEMQPLPEAMAGQPIDQKSPAQWAYERLILYIKNFEEQLDARHEVAMGLTGGEAGILRIEGIGYFDPDIITFYGHDDEDARTQLIQHVSQLNVMLRALPKADENTEARRIGFELAARLRKR